MKISTLDQDYIEKARLLTKEEAERLYSRMSEKLTRQLKKEKFSPLEALALQLQREDEQLNEWRQAFRKYSENKP
jgi:hypothetical protein